MDVDDERLFDMQIDPSRELGRSQEGSEESKSHDYEVRSVSVGSRSAQEDH